MKGIGRRCGCSRAWLFALVGAVGCQRADVAVHVEKLELAQGSYYDLSWGGAQVERFVAVARIDAADGDAQIVSPSLKQPCSLGPVAQYAPIRPRSSSKYVQGSPSPALVPVFDTLDADGYGTLGFAGVDCRRTDFEIPDVSKSYWLLPEADPAGLKLAAVTRDQTLLLVDPWAEVSLPVAHDVGSKIVTSDTAAWLIEGGALVEHDLTGRVVLRIGSNVSEFWLLGGYDVAYVDDGNAYVLRGGVTRKLADDACSVHSVDAFAPGAIAYFSPCSERQLVVRFGVGKSRRYAQGVVEYTPQPGRLFYTTTDDSTTTLWVLTAGQLDRANAVTQQPAFRIRDLWTTRDGPYGLVTKRQNDATYSVWQVDIDRAGNLVALTVIDEGLPQAPAETADGLAVVYGDGTLHLYDRDGGILRWTVPGVSLASFVFSDKYAGLAYLSHVDPDTQLGHLSLHLLSGAQLEIDDDVRDFTQVWWPELGLLYAKGGERPALKFARIAIPCQMTGDFASWACGF